jgi:hypothetical protein
MVATNPSLGKPEHLIVAAVDSGSRAPGFRASLAVGGWSRDIIHGDHNNVAVRFKGRIAGKHARANFELEGSSRRDGVVVRGRRLAPLTDVGSALGDLSQAAVHRRARPAHVSPSPSPTEID